VLSHNHGPDKGGCRAAVDVDDVLGNDLILINNPDYFFILSSRISTKLLLLCIIFYPGKQDKVKFKNRLTKQVKSPILDFIN
jgi:hypothetical protein